MSADMLILLPILLPFITGIVTLLALRRQAWQRYISLAGSVLHFLATVWLFVFIYNGGPYAIQIGGWPAPYGITIVADLFSALMVLMAGLMGLTVGVYSLVDINEARVSMGYHPLYHFLLMGVCGSFLTGDVFNLFVWFEVMLISSFVLLALGGYPKQLEGAVKYMTLNLLASAAFLAAVGILYGLAGTLNMADLPGALASAPQGLVTTLSMLFLIAFGIKSALFPLFGWLPSAYHTPPTAVSAIFASLLTKVGVYAIIRMFTLLFVQNVTYTHTFVLLILAGFTMVTGVFGAATQNDFRRILSFHIVSQIGYMIMGLALFSPLALAGAVLHIVHNIINKTNLFLVSGIVNRIQGTNNLKKLGGLYRTQPLLSVLFLVPALALAGIPPLPGFWSKYLLVRAGLETEQYVIVAVSLFVGLLTLFSMTKIWTEAFWKQQQDDAPQTAVPATDWRTRLLSVATLSIISVGMGLLAGPLFETALTIAEQLLQPELYVTAVLGGN